MDNVAWISCEKQGSASKYFLRHSRDPTERNLLLNNVQFMQDNFTKVNINDILQECDFYTKI